MLKYGDVRNPTFLEIVQRMINEKLPLPVTAKMLNLAKQINDERLIVNGLIDKLVRDKSEVVKEDGNPDLFKIKESEQATFNQEFQELNDTIIQTTLEQIEPSQLKTLELSVNELLAIAPLLVGGEELAGLRAQTPALPSV